MTAARLTLFFVLGFSLTLTIGCIPGKVTRKWSEEVALDDGRVIIVDRYVAFEESNSWAGDAYSATETRSTISFRGELAKLPDWDVPLVPVLLYQDASDGNWAVVATTSSCEIWAERGSPQPPYWEYRLTHGAWSQTSLSRASIGRKPNLLFAYNENVAGKKITAAEKVLQSDDAGIVARYRLISESVDKSCM